MGKYAFSPKTTFLISQYRIKRSAASYTHKVQHISVSTDSQGGSQLYFKTHVTHGGIVLFTSQKSERRTLGSDNIRTCRDGIQIGLLVGNVLQFLFQELLRTL
jgi:hypothetical protein